MSTLKGKRILIFVDHLYEDLELWYPKLRFTEEGAEVFVAGPEEGLVYTGKNGYPCRSDTAIGDMESRDFDALVLPGGFAPDKLRRDPRVLQLTREFHEAGKPLAYICHAGWIPISAGVMNGFLCTSSPGIRDDLKNAGAEWVDEPVVVDRHQISSRNPNDLPHFCREIIKALIK